MHCLSYQTGSCSKGDLTQELEMLWNFSRLELNHWDAALNAIRFCVVPGSGRNYLQKNLTFRRFLNKNFLALLLEQPDIS